MKIFIQVTFILVLLFLLYLFIYCILECLLHGNNKFALRYRNRKYNKIIKHVPVLGELILQYKTIYNNQCKAANEEFGKISNEEQRLRDQIPTATLQELRTYSKRIEELKIQGSIIHDQFMQGIKLLEDIEIKINDVLKSTELTQNERKFIYRHYWHYTHR